MKARIEFPPASDQVVGAKHRDLEAMLAAMANKTGAGGSVVSQRNRLVGLTSRPPSDQGIGTWDYIQLSPDLILSLTDVDYLRDTTIQIEGDDTFKVRVVLRGRVRSNRQAGILSAPFVYVEAYPGNCVGSYEVLAGGLKMLVLHCRTRELLDGLGLHDLPMPAPIARLFAGGHADSPEGDAVRIGAEVMRAASDVLAAVHQYPPELLPPFLLAKSREILCSVLRQLSAPSIDSVAHGLRSRDVNRIYEARDIVMSNLESPLPLAELARTVGVCQTKLKAGFKAIFGTTVFEYARARQMDRAMDLLLMTDKSISQIAYEVGYSYPANFTHAFKRHFDFLPTDVRRSDETADDSTDSLAGR